MLAVHLRDRDLVSNRARLRGRIGELLHSRNVHPCSVHSEGAHHGFRKSTNALMAVGSFLTPVGVDVDPGSSQRVREFTNTIVLAERRYRNSRSVQSDWLLFHQRQSEKKFVSEFIKVYGQKDILVGRQHG